MPEEIENLKRRIKGVRAVILIKGKGVILSEFDDAKTERLSHSIYYLVSTIKEIHGFRGAMIAAKNGDFFVFSRENQLLGVLSDSKTNFALLRLLVRKIFSFEEKKEVTEPETIQEDEIPFFLRISCSDYYKRYPKEYSKDQNE